MFCPKCATENLEGARFCRSCGTNIALIPQAISGQLEAQNADQLDSQGNLCVLTGKQRKTPTTADGINKIFTGLGFLCAAIAIAIFGHQIAGQVWWFWLLIPAFASIGKGVANVVAARQRTPGQFAPAQASLSAPPRMPVLRQASTGEIIAPAPSVTEGTTRHLGVEVPARSFGDNQSSVK